MKNKEENIIIGKVNIKFFTLIKNKWVSLCGHDSDIKSLKMSIGHQGNKIDITYTKEIIKYLYNNVNSYFKFKLKDADLNLWSIISAYNSSDFVMGNIIIPFDWIETKVECKDNLIGKTVLGTTAYKNPKMDNQIGILRVILKDSALYRPLYFISTDKYSYDPYLTAKSILKDMDVYINYLYLDCEKIGLSFKEN